jgi:hypothetical protein
LVAVGCVFLLGLLGGFFIPRLAMNNSPARVYNTATIIRQVQTLSELVTVKYVMEKIVVIEAPSDSILGQMFAGDNRVLLLAHGIVKAGVDMGELKEGDIQIENGTVKVKMPKPRITDAYLDDRQTRVIERTTGLFRTFDKDLEQSARRDAVDDIRRAARTGGIVKDAEDRARGQIKALLEPMGLKVEFVSE